jgi:hypothetical protein
MKYTKEQLYLIEKSFYKAVKKTIDNALLDAKDGQEIVEDILDDNFTAEALDVEPPEKTSNMNKSESSVEKLRKFMKK